MPERRPMPGVPYMPEICGFVNRDLALQITGLTEASANYLQTLILKGYVKAAYFNAHTLMYERQSLEEWAQSRGRGTAAESEPAPS